MRYLAQALVVGVIALFTITLFSPQWLNPRAGVPQAKTSLVPLDDPSIAQTPETESDASIVVDESPSSGDAETATPAARTKLVQSLKSAAQVIDEKIPGNDVSVTSQIVDTLDQADRILSDAQVANRQTLASVNRQVRLPGRSPPLMVVVVPGLQQRHVDEVDKNTHAGLRRLGTEGTLIAGMRSTGSSAISCIQTITYAQPIDVTSETIPPSLMSMLWHSGYSTTMVGDLSWTASTDPAQIARHGIEQSFGLKTAAEIAEAFPKHVWSNGIRVRVPANESSAQVSADQIFVNEAVLKVAGNPQNHRPQAVMLVLPESEAEVATRCDQVVASLMQKLDTKRLSERTLFVVVGVPSAADGAAQPVALVRWPRNIAPGGVIDHQCDAVDLTPTILALTQSQRISKAWPGKSQAEVWRSTPVPPREIAPTAGAPRTSPDAKTDHVLPKA